MITVEERSTSRTSPNSTFADEVLTYQAELLRTARRLVGEQEAEDLFQETMLKAFRFAHTYQPGTNLHAWLFRILNTSAINRYRKQATHPTPVALPEGEESSLSHQIRDLSGQDWAQGAEEEVLGHSLDEEVAQALDDLAPAFRLAVVLADIEEFSYKEIADALQIPLGTVMSRIFRGHQRLRKSLWQYAKERGYLHRPLQTAQDSS